MTCLGIDNTGDYVFSYGKEDTDYYVDGDPTSDYVFRCADSVFFCRLRDLFPSEMEAMFKNREEKGAWLSGSLIDQWDKSQTQFPEELWRLDYERKYYRTYLGLSIDNSIAQGADKTFLIGKFFGRKKYARRAFEINQEIYFATKYFGNKALEDVFYIRGNVPIGGNIKPNYSLILVPYSDMYVCVKYGSTGSPIHKKIKAGQTCVFESDAERMDFIYVYAASYIQEVGDLSRCYVGDNNFSNAIRLQKLVIGSTADGYQNTFMKEVLVANNPLLEYLDLRNVSGINTEIDVRSCSNLKELYAEGTNATGALFANGGLLQTAHLPNTITSLSMKNLNYIKDFVVAGGYNNLQTLIVENTPSIDTYDVVMSAPLLKLIRLINLNWGSTYQIENNSIFERLFAIGGIDSSGHETDPKPDIGFGGSVLTGTISVPVIGQYELYKYKTAWPDLTINPTTTIKQFVVTFVNDDGTVLDTQYVNQFENAVDPITRANNPIATPTKDSTIQYNYTYAGWDSTITNVVADRTITATYKSSLREYTIQYVSKGTPVKTSKGLYGDTIIYSGDTPVYTKEEPHAFYLFNRWDKSGRLTGDFDENGVKTVNAIFDKFEYVDGCFDGKDISDMSLVEIYAMTKLGLESQYVESKDSISITLGNDISYDDIEEEVVIANKTVFNGSNHIDTNIKLFDEDKDFVLAIEYSMDSNNTNNNVLAQCFSGYSTSGFRLWYNSGAKLGWGSSNESISETDRREIAVIRHVKGEQGVHAYVSNTSGDTSTYVNISSKLDMKHNGTLVFGCNKADDGSYENHAKGIVYWCKVWYSDFGHEVCSQLACWPHEQINLEMCGFKRYYLSDGSGKRSSMSFLSSGVLNNPMGLQNDYNATNEGGWANCTLNKYLNSRIYDAIPVVWRQLIKQVQVKSSAGNKSMNIVNSDCYITIPSVKEISSLVSGDPYDNEGNTIDYFVYPEDRICYNEDGIAVNYWTRSPNVGYSSYNYYIKSDGSAQPVGTLTNKYYIRIMISI